MRNLIARLYRGLISSREFSKRVSDMNHSRATAESIQDSVTGFKAEPYSEKTPYRQWIESEGIPIHVGYHMPDVRVLHLAPWDRVGVQGAHVVLEGAEGTDASYIFEIPVGGRTRPQRYLFEEVIYVLEGEGVLHTEGFDEPVAPGSCIHLPPFLVHSLENSGDSPMRIVAVFHPAGDPASRAYDANQ